MLISDCSSGPAFSRRWCGRIARTLSCVCGPAHPVFVEMYTHHELFSEWLFMVRRYELSDTEMPGLRKWMEETRGIDMENHRPAQVGARPHDRARS